MMDQGDNRCIIHILSEEGDFQGCGYLFNGRYAITSGSVIRKCLGCDSGRTANPAEQEIMVSLPFGSDSDLRPCRIVYCNCGRNRLCDNPQYQDHPVDLALIEFLRPFVFRPGSRMADVNGREEVRVRLLDFTNDREPGKPISGQVEGEVETGIKVLGFDGGIHEGVRPGYSGAPVFNTDDGTCIGLQIDLPAELVNDDGGTCCLLPAATILRELDGFDIEGRYPVRRNPYMGPRPFEAGNQRDFYGRTAETERLTALVNEAPVVPVIGTAGIGKTSLVQAGLIGNLSKDEWVAVKVEAGADIEERIIDALFAARDERIDNPDMFDEAVESGAADRSGLVETLRAVEITPEGSPLVSVVRRIFNSDYFPEEEGVPKVLLFIDDMERIFDERVHIEIRDRLFRLLGTVTRDEQWSDVLRVVFALRSESYDSYMEQGSIVERHAEHEIKIFKLSREKLHEAVTVPAGKLSVRFEEDLVDMMLIDWENERQPLAVLQLVLRQLWPRQRKYRINTAAYREITADGGLTALAGQIVSKTNGHHPVTTEREEGRPLRRDQDFTPVKFEIPGEEPPAAQADPAPPAPEPEVEIAVAEPVVETAPETEAPVVEESRNGEVERESVDSILFSDEEGEGEDGPVDLEAQGPRSGRTDEDKKKKNAPHRFDEESGRVNKVPTADTDATKTGADGDEIPDEELDFSGDPAFDVTILPVSSEAERAERIASRAVDIHETRNPDMQLATLLAVEAARVDSNLTTNSVLRECIRHLPRAVHTFKQTHTIWSTVFSNNGRLVATAGGDRSARVYDLETGNELHCINHKDIIRYVAFSSNDCLLASVSSDGTAIVTNVETGDRICRIQEPTKIHGMAFSKDGRMLALSSYTSAKVYRVDTGEEVLHSRHGDKIYAVAFSDDTSLVATASHDGKIKIFRLRSANEIASFEHRDWVINITFSPDNTLLASASGDKTARVWRIGTGEEVCRVRHDDWVRAVVFNHDGRFIATAGGDHTASVWYVNIGKEVCRVIHDDWVRAVAFSPDGNLLATSSRDGSAKITEIQSSRTVLKIHHNGSVNTARFNQDGSLVGTASSDGTARICPLVSSEGVCKVDHTAEVRGLTFSEDGSLLTTYGGDRAIKLTRVATNELVRTITAEDHQSTVRASGDGRLVAVGCGSGVVAIHNVETGERICRTQLDAEVTALCFNRDYSQLAAGAANGNLIVFEVPGGRQLNRMTLEGRVNALAFDDSGKFLALGLETGLTTIYRIAREQEIFRVKYKDAVTDVNFNFKSSLIITAGRDGTARVSKVNGGNGVCMVRHDGPVYTAEINVNNKHIVTASEDGTARIWRMDTGAELFRIQHEGPVTAARFHSEGNLVITASRDCTSKVCLATTGEELCQIHHDGPVNAAVFNGEGTRIATAGADGIAKVSYRFTIDLMREARRRLTRNITQAEWKRYFGREPYRTTVPWLPDGM